MNKLARATASPMQATSNLTTSNSDNDLRIAHPPVMSVSGLYKSYRKGKIEVPVLKGVDLSIPTGDFTTIVGTSGSGKSTLLHLLGRWTRPTPVKSFTTTAELTTCQREKKNGFATASLG